MDRENELLDQLAERPFDRSLRLVFADWLSERGDPRGEVITLAERGSLSLTERRRVARLTQENAHAWLGPLNTLTEPGLCRFEAGFLSQLVCQVPPSPEVWDAVAGDPRLATVTNLVLPVGVEPAQVSAFLRSPRFRWLKRLQAGGAAWAQLRSPPPTSFSLDVVAVSSWGVFRQELDGLLALVDGARAASRLELATSEFLNPATVNALTEALFAQQASWRPFQEVRLLARFGVVEGASRWLVAGALGRLERNWQRGKGWSVEFGDAVFRLERSEERFSALVVDLAQNEDLSGLGQRIGVAAAVLVQLATAKIASVSVLAPPIARWRASEKDALRAAVRRLGTVKRMDIGGVPVPP